LDSRWCRDFPHPFKSAPKLTQPPVQLMLDLLPGGKATGGGVDHPHPSNPSVPPIPRYGVTFTFTYTVTEVCEFYYYTDNDHDDYWSSGKMKTWSKRRTIRNN